MEARWLHCTSGINTHQCQLEAYRPLQRQLFLPLLNPALKFVIASHAEWEICPWVISRRFPSWFACCSRAALAPWAVVPDPRCRWAHASAGPSPPSLPLPGLCLPALPALLITGGAARSRGVAGSLLLSSVSAGARWLSRCCQGRKEAKRQRKAWCCLQRALSSVPLPIEQ